MWRFLIMYLLAVVASCTGTKSSPDQNSVEEEERTSSATPVIQGEWEIENIVESDTAYVRPAEIDPDMTVRINFNDDCTFGVMTNCNHLGGNYVQKDDSLHLTDIFTTEMACEDMSVEDMLKKILPMVNTIDCLNDSITRLNTGIGQSYIVLRKMLEPVK